MLQAGKVYPSVTFPFYPIERASSIASIYTGTYTSSHGLAGSIRYDREKHRPVHTLWDERVQGVYTRDQYSPRALRSATLADRLKEASEGASLVYSVGIYAEDAIVAGGSMPDGCFWLDSKIGSWASSSYYPKLPTYIDKYNRSADGPNKRLISGQMQWRPLHKYTDQPIRFASWSKGFEYRYGGHEGIKYKQSPLSGQEVTSLALKLIEHGGYQQRSAPGLLALSYSLHHTGSGELSGEEVDRYLRLDRDLGQLLEALDRHIGLKHCLIALTGTGYVTYPTKPLKQYGRDERELSLGQASALVNMYLTANYGSGSWVQKIYGNRIYLNRQLIEEKKLDLARLQDQVVQLWREVKGVGRVYSAHQLTSRGDYPPLSLLRRAIFAGDDADVYWDLLPSWSIKEETEYPEWQRRASLAIRSPFILMGSGVDPASFDYPVPECADIVGAVCAVLRIRPPNDIR